MPADSERCPDDNTLARLVAGELADAERAAVERHLGSCAACAELIAEYARAAPQREVPARYRLIRLLGRGAMGEVWEAEDHTLGRRLALKFVRGEASADRQYRERLVREARALARLDHPSVVGIYDLEEARDGELFMALELVEGTDARAWRDAAPRTFDEILRVWRRVGDALEAAHRAGIVHRDLKPENVMIAGDRVVLGDFGLASRLPDGSTTLTATGQVVGTPLYMPLEQLRGEPATARGDQFALCVCMWEAIVGERPFGGGTVPALLAAMREPLPLPLRHRGVLAVLARGLSPDPAARWPTVAALVRALDGVRRKQRLWLAAIAAFGVATGLALAALAL